jgi:hypothetical protein
LQRSRERFVEVGGQGTASWVEGDEVDVLTQSSIGVVCSGEGGAADEVEPVGEMFAEVGEEQGDEVVSFDLFGCDAELVGDTVAFVEVHEVACTQVSARERAAVSPCPSAVRRSRSLRR